MKAFKYVGIFLGLIILLIAGGIVYVFMNADSLIKRGVETYGPMVTQTDVQLESANFKITQGLGQLNGLRVGNPQGFTDANIFEMEQVLFHVDTTSLTEDVMVIKEITIDGAKLFVEQKGFDETNISALMDNVSSFTGDSSSAPAPKEPTPQADGPAEPVMMMLQQFNFTNAKVRLLSEQLGERELTLPKVTASNIGDRNTGLTPEQLTAQLVEKVSQAAERETRKLFEKELQAKGQEALEKELDKHLDDEQKEQVNKLKGLLK